MNEPKPQKSDREYYLFALKIVGDFGITLAAPVVIFVLIGQHFDEKYGHYPFFTVSAFIVSAVLSGLIIWRKAKKYGEIYRKMK